MEFKEITEKIIGCAYKVYNKMGYGFFESVYEKCLLIELRKAGLKSEYQKQIIVNYEGEVVGNFIADIFVEELIILELKSYPADPVNPVKCRGREMILSHKKTFSDNENEKKVFIS